MKKVALISLLLFLLVFALETNVLADTYVAKVRKTYFHLEIEGKDVVEFNKWSYDVRHYGVNWRKRKNVFRPLPVDLAYMDTRWLGSEFRKVFYLWGESNDRFRVMKDKAYCNGKLYGLLITKDSIPVQEDGAGVKLKYLEIACPLNAESAKTLIERHPNLELINLRVKSEPQIVARLCRKLPIRYVHWGFLDVTHPFEGPQQEYEKLLPHLWEYEQWFHGFFEALGDKHSLWYLSLKCVSDWVAPYVSSFGDQLKGLMISASLTHQSLNAICDSAKGLTGFIANNERPYVTEAPNAGHDKRRFFYYPNEWRDGLMYFRGILNCNGYLFWKSLVACTGNEDVFKNLFHHRNLRDACLLNAYNLLEKHNILGKFRYIVRFRGKHIESSLFGGEWPQTLSIIEGGFLILEDRDMNWFSSAVKSVETFSISFSGKDFSLALEKCKSSCLRVLFICSAGSIREGRTGMIKFIKEMQPKQGYKAIAVIDDCGLSLRKFSEAKIITEEILFLTADGYKNEYDAELARRAIRVSYSGKGYRNSMFLYISIFTDDFIEAVWRLKLISDKP